MLSTEGRLFLSVPNPWYMNYCLKSVFKASQHAASVDHVARYDAATLTELGARHGLDLVRYTGVVISRVNTARMKLLLPVIPALIRVGIKYEFFSNSMVYEFRLL